MATPLEIKKAKAELLRVQAAKADQEVSIDEALAQVDRLRLNMQVQEKREAELVAKIADMQSNVT